MQLSQEMLLYIGKTFINQKTFHCLVALSLLRLLPLNLKMCIYVVSSLGLQSLHRSINGEGPKITFIGASGPLMMNSMFAALHFATF